MARTRQITANQRNSRKSTGPRSSGGKKRAGRNAFRHGLSVSSSSIPQFLKQLHKLARKIAGDSKDPFALQRARAIAAAELDLERVRRIKLALIERVCAMEVDPIDPADTVSPQADQGLESIRHILSELIRLSRYEERAARRRDQAVLQSKVAIT
jgi:hypothetical protein